MRKKKKKKKKKEERRIRVKRDDDYYVDDDQLTVGPTNTSSDLMVELQSNINKSMYVCMYLCI